MKAILRKIKWNRSPAKEPAAHVSNAQKTLSVETRKPRKIDAIIPTGTLLQFNDPVPDDGTTKDYLGFDIVAIHGLGGDSIETWEHSDGTLWLRDLLPDALPGVRVFSYGYPSDIFLSSSKAGIRGYATHFLDRLDSILLDNDESRPIVYLCHSLGGIVFKQAMILAPERYPDVWMQSKGVMFFGTPHRGSFAATPAKLLGDILNTAWSVGRLSRIATKTELLQDLQQNSRILLATSDDFTQRASELQIVTYFETEITPGTGTLIVEESSAIIGVAHERRSPMYRNHSDICKFSANDAGDLQSVMQNLKRMRKAILATRKDKEMSSSIRSGASFNSYEKECIRYLNAIDVAGHMSRLDQPAAGTFQWISQNPQYNVWTSGKDTNLLCVTGYAGCGKTVLSSYVSEKLGSEYRESLICRYFFDGKIPEQTKASSFLRSIIHQVVRDSRKLIKIVKRSCEILGTSLFDQFSALWDLFIEIVGGQTKNICIIIDAVDECEKEFQEQIIDRIALMLKSSTSPKIKFLMTTRPNASGYQLLRSKYQDPDDYIHLGLEDEQETVDKDINTVIHTRLDRLVKGGMVDQCTREALEKSLVSRAERTFLWVSIVLSLLERGDHIFLSQSDLMSFLEKLPVQLAETYRNYLESIPMRSRDQAGRILRLLVASARPLELRELYVILAIKESHHSLQDLDFNLAPPPLPLLLKHLGPLVRASEIDSKIELHLLHTSLREYLIDLGTRSDDPLSAQFGVDLPRESMNLAQSCMWYLSFEDFRRDLSKTRPLEDDQSSLSTASYTGTVSDISQEDLSWSLFGLANEDTISEKEHKAMLTAQWPFFDYAATQWANHFRHSNHIASSGLHDIAGVLCDTHSQVGESWFQHFWACETKETTRLYQRRPSFGHPVSAASYLGLGFTVRYLLKVARCDTEQVGNAIYWAARMGHENCLREMIHMEEVSPSMCYHDGDSPLVAAASSGHLGCVRELIQGGYFDVNEKGKYDLSSLASAARGGHTEVVKELLSLEEKIDVNSSDHDGSTPLFWAVSLNSSQTTMQLISDSRVDMNHRDGKGRSALTWAVADGNEDQVRLLISSVRTDVGIQDDSGRTALMLAAKIGHESILRMLLRTKRARPDARDENGRNAISWASSQQNYKALHRLLNHEHKHGGSGADVEDIDGWSPLAWALDIPGFPNNFSLLLQSQRADPDHKSKNGRSILSLAAGYGHLEITQSLVQTKGVDLNSRCRDGRTPISYAAGAGRTDVVDLLLQQQPKLDAGLVDNSGRAPLWWARSGGYPQIVHMLEENSGAIDVWGI